MDVSGLTPDQQFEAGLYCGSVHATPTTPIGPNDLCPGSQYGSNLVKILAPGTENDDHNPPRIQPRNLFDIAVGHDNILGGDRFKVSARLTIVNLTDKEALYNFLSTFSGTHLRYASRDHGYDWLPLLGSNFGVSPFFVAIRAVAIDRPGLRTR